MTSHASLTDDLAALRAHYAVHIPPHIAAAMIRADAALAASTLVDRALRAGEFAPDFMLPDVDGAPVSLARALRDGPAIVSFYRGGWCPYCNFELRAYQSRAEAMRHAGVRLIAISPQTPDATASTVRENGLGFQVVSDVGSKVARAFGVAFDLADELRPLYARLGHALPEQNGEGWVLPVPATFVIAPSGEIVLAFIDTDYRRRLDPNDALLAAIAVSVRRAA